MECFKKDINLHASFFIASATTNIASTTETRIDNLTRDFVCYLEIKENFEKSDLNNIVCIFAESFFQQKSINKNFFKK